jgi:predicted transcriptional regulator
MSQPMFDYQSVAKKLQISPQVVQDLEEQGKQEFPGDAMLMELHILRALNAYINKK